MRRMTHNKGPCYTNPNDEVQLVPPDGGWGWIVISASFFLQMLVHSLTLGFGVVYVFLVRRDSYSNMAASAIPALMTGISSLLAPISSSLSVYYSHRKLVFIGVALLGTGVGLSAFSLRLPWLYFCLGVLGGVGHSLAAPQIFMIGQKYFQKRRVTAHALASLGGTVGFTVVPVFIYILINFYAIQGAFLVWSAVIFNGLIAAMLYQPIDWHLKQQRPTKDNYTNIRNESNTTYTKTNQDLPMNGDVLHEREPLEDAIQYECNNTEDTFFETTFAAYRMSFISAKSLDSYQTAKSASALMESETMVSCLDLCDSFGSSPSLMDTNKSLSSYTPEVTSIEGTNGSNTKKASSVSPTSGTSEYNPYIVCGIKFPRITEILSFRLLANPIFLVIVISSICNRQLYYSFSTYLPLIAKEVVEVSQIPYLLSIVSANEVIGKFLMIAIGDKGWIAKRYYYMSSGIISCIAVAVLGMSQNFSQMAIGSALFGIGIGIAIAIGPVLLVEYLSLSLLPYSYGLNLFIGGVFNIIMYLLQGWTVDVTQSTIVLCSTIASLALVPSILWAGITVIILVKENQNQKSNKQNLKAPM